MDRLTARTREAVERIEVPDGSPRERLLAFVSAYVASYEEQGATLPIVFGSVHVPMVREVVEEMRAWRRRELQRILRSAERAGGALSSPPRGACRLLPRDGLHDVRDDGWRPRGVARVGAGLPCRDGRSGCLRGPMKPKAALVAGAILVLSACAGADARGAIPTNEARILTHSWSRLSPAHECFPDARSAHADRSVPTPRVRGGRDRRPRRGRVAGVPSRRPRPRTRRHRSGRLACADRWAAVRVRLGVADGGGRGPRARLGRGGCRGRLHAGVVYRSRRRRALDQVVADRPAIRPGRAIDVVVRPSFRPARSRRLLVLGALRRGAQRVRGPE